jgi:cysteine synthase A
MRTLPRLSAALAGGLSLCFATATGAAAALPGAGLAGASPALPAPPSPPPPFPTILDCIGGTPLLELPTLSRATGCTILAKAEHLNPGLSVKDRAARNILAGAEAAGRLVPGVTTVVEATGGNTGVALAFICAAKGVGLVLTMPDYVAKEKVLACEAMGARVLLCPSEGVPFADPRHFYQVAKRMGEQPGYVWGNQFEGLLNREAHAQGTGPEIASALAARSLPLHAFVVSAGTGGTLAGVGSALRAAFPAIKLFLIDPAGSSLAAYVRCGVLQASEGRATTLEGIGIGRITANFASCPPLDGVYQGSDAEAVEMMLYLAQREGLFVGPSAALNVVGAVKAARALGPGHTVATVLCDSGARYLSKHFNPSWRAANALGSVAQQHPQDGQISFVK